MTLPWAGNYLFQRRDIFVRFFLFFFLAVNKCEWVAKSMSNIWSGLATRGFFLFSFQSGPHTSSQLIFRLEAACLPPLYIFAFAFTWIRPHFHGLMIVLSSVGSFAWKYCLLQQQQQLLCLTICVHLLSHSCILLSHSHTQLDRMSVREGMGE